MVWVKGFGYADADKRIHATGDTLYHLGPVSKIFTAAEVLKLAGEGRVGLDKPLLKDLPGFSYPQPVQEGQGPDGPVAFGQPFGPSGSFPQGHLGGPAGRAKILRGRPEVRLPGGPALKPL